MSSSDITAEAKYEEIVQSKDDLEVAEILTNIVENVDETTRFFNTVKDHELHTIANDLPEGAEVVRENSVEHSSKENDMDIHSSNNVPTLSSHDYPLDPNSLVHFTLLDLIIKVVSDHELQKKYEFPIDAKYIECLKQIVEKHPNYFGSFEKSLMAIVKDGRISVSDFPEIVRMVMELYTILYSINPHDLVDMCAGVLKTVFFIAVKEKIIVVDNENEVIGAFDNSIDSIVELLKMHIQLYGGWNKVTCNFKKLFWF
jgi:hypothetical protein